MKQIACVDPKLAGILGEQKRKAGLRYVPARYVLRVPFEDGTLLCHTLSGELLLLEKGESPESREDELIRARFLVPEGYDEQKQARDLRALLPLLQPKDGKKTGFTVLTTADCNARCYYCYEKGRRRLPMSEQVARDAAAYMARASGGEELSISWFGGEPLYNRRAIEIITEELRERGVPFRSSMATNGYYLDAETARTAKNDWNLKWVQITLDGTKEIYQRSKAYIERDENAFERVLDNIAAALENGIRVTVRLNVSRANAEDLTRLVELLAGRFGGEPLFSVYAHLLFENVGAGSGFAEEAEGYQALERLQACIARNGLSREKGLKKAFKTNCCMADSDKAEVILPDGRIGKCEHFSESEIVGSIYSDEYDTALIRAWKELRPLFPECGDCPLMPSCRALRKCPDIADHCSDAEREHKIGELQRRVLAEYEKWKSGTPS